MWNEKEKYRDLITQIGAFHKICAYFNVLGKKVEGSDLAEVQWCYNWNHEGKTLQQGFGVHLTVCETLERLLLERSVSSVDGSNMFITHNVKKAAL